MRLIGRNDLFLLLGLTAALFAIFSRPLARALDWAREIDRSWGLQLVPGLVILAVVLTQYIPKSNNNQGRRRRSIAY